MVNERLLQQVLQLVSRSAYTLTELPSNFLDGSS